MLLWQKDRFNRKGEGYLAFSLYKYRIIDNILKIWYNVREINLYAGEIMSLKSWFKWWLRSLRNLIFPGAKLSNPFKDINKERRKRREYERKRHGRDYKPQKRKPARSQNHILLDKLGNLFLATIMFPVALLNGLSKWLKKLNSKAKKAGKNKANSSTKSSPKSHDTDNKQKYKTNQNNGVKKDTRTHTNTVNSTVQDDSTSFEARERTEVKKEEEKVIAQKHVYTATPQIDNKIDENKPKSNPQNTADKWIRKRMTAEAKRELMIEVKVGDVLDMKLTDDKSSVMLIHPNSTVGTVALVHKDDTLPLATALKLGRNLYAIITDIKITEYSIEIEFEGWQQHK